MEININCDFGESSKFHSTENDPLLLKIVNSANIACGYHAGDKKTMENTIKISKGIIFVIIGLIRGLIPIFQGWMFGIPGLIILSNYFPTEKRLLHWPK